MDSAPELPVVDNLTLKRVVEALTFLTFPILAFSIVPKLLPGVLLWQSAAVVLLSLLPLSLVISERGKGWARHGCNLGNVSAFTACALFILGVSDWHEVRLPTTLTNQPFHWWLTAAFLLSAIIFGVSVRRTNPKYPSLILVALPIAGAFLHLLVMSQMWFRAPLFNNMIGLTFIELSFYLLYPHLSRRGKFSRPEPKPLPRFIPVLTRTGSVLAVIVAFTSSPNVPKAVHYAVMYATFGVMMVVAVIVFGYVFTALPPTRFSDQEPLAARVDGV